MITITEWGLHAGAVVSTVASQHGGPGFDLQIRESFMISLCLHVFIPGSPASPHHLKVMKLGNWPVVSVCLYMWHWNRVYPASLTAESH